jgi:hypothetical protein
MLSLLYFLEGTTSIARIAGIKNGALAIGLQIQSSLSIFSRGVNALFMPMLGYMADKLIFQGVPSFQLVAFNLIVSLALLVPIILEKKIEYFFIGVANGIKHKGVLWPIFNHKKTEYVKHRNNPIFFKKIKIIRVVTFISYIPYYLSWAVCILAMKEFPDSRGMVLGMTSAFNGINTLALVLIVDPKLVQLSKYKKVSYIVLKDQLKIRFFSSLTSFLILIIIAVGIGYE